MTSNKVSSLGLLRLAGQTMNQSKPFWTKGRVVAVVLAMCSTGPAYLLYRYNHKVEYWLNQQDRFLRYRFGSGLEHDLCVGNIKAGDSVDTVLQKYPTLNHDEIGRWTFLYPGLRFSETKTTIVARDGHLISAGISSCFYSDTFFKSELSAGDREEFESAKERRQMLTWEEQGIPNEATRCR